MDDLPLPSCMYAIVCSEKTSSVWPNAREKLRLKYESKWPGKVQVVSYREDAGVTSILVRLSQLKPSFTCFLAHHSECGRGYVQAVNKLTRQLDPSHPYTDTLWGILTGHTEDDILFSLRQSPLEIRRVLGNCPVDLEKFQSGVWFSEFEQGTSYRKTLGRGVVCQEACRADPTRDFIEELGTERDALADQGVDMVITSGHATERDLNLGYTFRGGKLCCQKGQLYGLPLHEGEVDVKASVSPKILSAAGNCLMGHVSDADCMALGWLHSGCVVQMVSYVVETWFGYGGWGVHKYFVNNPGSMTFSEAFFANQQSLLHQIAINSAPSAADLMSDHTAIYHQCFETNESATPELSRDISGLLYDRDNVSFYGDPVWEARLTTNADVYNYTTTITKLGTVDGWTHWAFTVTTTKPGRWDCSVADDKTTCPGRPPLYVFPCAVAGAKVMEGNAVVTCRFVLLPLAGSFQAGEEHKIVFATKSVSDNSVAGVFIE